MPPDMAARSEAASSPLLRLDPQSLPLRFPDGAGRARGSAILYLDATRAVLRRRLASAAEAETVPISSYRGVAARVVPVGSQGAIRVSLELLHRDFALCVTLAVADDPADIAADWAAWARLLNLPVLFIDRDGAVTDHSDHQAFALRSPAKPRRRNLHPRRRPRFMLRRKPGSLAAPAQLSGREIIARH